MTAQKPRHRHHDLPLHQGERRVSKVGNFKATDDIKPDGEPEVGIVQKHGEDFEKHMHCVLVISGLWTVRLLQRHANL